jgi:hypothetical protein
MSVLFGRLVRRRVARGADRRRGACEVRRWTVLGGLWATLAAVGWTLGLSEPVEGRYEPIPLLLVGVAWVGAVGTSLAIRSRYKRSMAARQADVQATAGDGGHQGLWPWLSLLPFRARRVGADRGRGAPRCSSLERSGLAVGDALALAG